MLAESCKNIVHRDALKNTAVVLIIYGIQFLLFQDIFRCPCRHYKSYGLNFLFVPSILLLALSLVVHKRFWSAVTTIIKLGNYSAKCNYFLSSLVEFFSPFLAPASWIVIALFRGNCYVCIRVGPGKECMSDTQQVRVVNFDHYYFQSFMLGSASLISMVIFATGITYIQRYCTTTYEHLPTHNDFVRARKQAVIEVFNNKTKELANDFAVKIVENAFCDRQESDMDIDERCIQAREKVQAICCDKPISGYMIDAAFSPMEVTSSSTM